MKLNTPIITIGVIGMIAYVMFKIRKKPTNPQPVDVIIDLEPTQSNPPVPKEEVVPIIHNLLKDDDAPYDKPGFGIDNHRNSDFHDLDDYLNLPLVGSGKTFNNSSLADIDIIPTPIVSHKYKYIRLSVKKTRYNVSNVSIGHIYFYSGSEKIDSKNIYIWNPHSGEKTIYRGEWSDDNMKTIIFCFPKAIEITRYDIKTSYKSPAQDPSLWTLEGSKNCSYWLPIHNGDEDLPILRGKVMYFDKFIDLDPEL